MYLSADHLSLGEAASQASRDALLQPLVHADWLLHFITVSIGSTAVKRLKRCMPGAAISTRPRSHSISSACNDVHHLNFRPADCGRVRLISCLSMRFSFFATGHACRQPTQHFFRFSSSMARASYKGFFAIMENHFGRPQYTTFRVTASARCSGAISSNWLSVDFGGVLTLGVFRLGCREKNWIDGMVVTERQPCAATLRSEIIFLQSAESCGRSGKKQKDFRSPAIRMDNDVASICPHKKQ